MDVHDPKAEIKSFQQLCLLVLVAILLLILLTVKVFSF